MTKGTVVRFLRSLLTWECDCWWVVKEDETTLGGTLSLEHHRQGETCKLTYAHTDIPGVEVRAYAGNIETVDVLAIALDGELA